MGPEDIQPVARHCTRVIPNPQCHEPIAVLTRIRTAGPYKVQRHSVCRKDQS